MPEEARLAGHHGTVQLAGTLGADGILTNVSVKQTSGSSLLDQAALNGIKEWKFTPALDPAGTPIAIPVTIPIEFYSFKTPDGGINHYNCRQWVVDTQWYAANFPDPKKDQFYLMMSGFSFAGAFSALGPNNDALKKASERFDRNWEAALNECRSKPDALVRDVLKLR